MEWNYGAGAVRVECRLPSALSPGARYFPPPSLDFFICEKKGCRKFLITPLRVSFVPQGS